MDLSFHGAMQETRTWRRPDGTALGESMDSKPPTIEEMMKAATPEKAAPPPGVSFLLGASWES